MAKLDKIRAITIDYHIFDHLKIIDVSYSLCLVWFSDLVSSYLVWYLHTNVPYDLNPVIPFDLW